MDGHDFELGFSGFRRHHDEIHRCFSGLPGGYRDYFGLFGSAGYFGHWWSSSSFGSSAWFRYLDSSNEYVVRSYGSRRFGFSVRCVRDAE